MRRQFLLRSLPMAIGLGGLILAASIQCTYARGRGGGFSRGGFSRGGFSREGAAAGGSFASRSGAMAGHERGMESGFRGAEAGHIDQAGHMEQANRMEEANRMEQANRMAEAAHLYHPYAGAAGAWDAGAAAAMTGAAAATTGAAIASTAAAATVAAPAAGAIASAPAAYAAAQPCANAVSVPVGRFTFFKCGTAWYRQAYGPAGPTFVQVARPGL